MKRSVIRTYSNQPTSTETLEHCVCAVCACAAYRIKWRLIGYQFVQCTQCAHIYQNPRPDIQALQERYSNSYCDYEIENAENFLQLMRLGIVDAGVESLLQKRMLPKRLLDIGCATGALLAYYQKKEWEVRGIELCKEAVAYARTHRAVAVDSGDYRQISLPQHYYSFIHSSHVIEHVADPFNFLRVIHTALHPHGYAVIVTPDVSGLQARILQARWRSAIADHLHLFHKRILYRLAARAGFEIVKKVSWGGLARGLAPRPIKTIADRLAKALNSGDVMLVVLRPKR